MELIENKEEKETMFEDVGGEVYSLATLNKMVKNVLTAYKKNNTALLRMWLTSAKMLYNNENEKEAQKPLLTILLSLDDKDGAIFKRLTGKLFPNLRLSKVEESNKDWGLTHRLVWGENGMGLNAQLAEALHTMVIEGGWSFRSRSFAERIAEVLGEVKGEEIWDWEKSVDAIVKRIEKHGHAADVVARLRIKLQLAT